MYEKIEASGENLIHYQSYEHLATVQEINSPP